MTGLGAWFDALEARGEEVDILFGCVRDGSAASEEWLTVSHVDFDGMGALGYVLWRRAGIRVALPTRSPHDPGRARCGLASAFELVARAPGWRPVRRRSRTQPEVLWWTADELVALRAVARAERSSPNSCLLWGAHQALADETGLPWLRDGIWMVPVNLRRNPRPARYRGNHASFVIGSPGGRSIEDLHVDIADRLARGEHWAHAAWLDDLARGGRLGLSLSMSLLAGTPLGFLGLFSNLGEWQVPELPGQAWCVGPPPTDMTPVAVGVLCINDRLALCARSSVLGPAALRRFLLRCRVATIGR